MKKRKNELKLGTYFLPWSMEEILKAIYESERWTIDENVKKEDIEADKGKRMKVTGYLRYESKMYYRVEEKVFERRRVYIVGEGFTIWGELLERARMDITREIGKKEAKYFLNALEEALKEIAYK